MTPFRQVQQFHRQFGLVSRDGPTAGGGLGAPAEQVALRRRLVEEEVGELAEACAAQDLVAVADALADIVYVALGTADLLGIPFDAVFDEVHRANMSKLGADGRPVLREDGKVLKGPDYTPPDVAGVLAAHRRGRGAADPDGGPAVVDGGPAADDGGPAAGVLPG